METTEGGEHQELYAAICDDLKGRSEWVSRQTTWYEMRHQGLRRKNKPWPGAADMHYPMADSTIEKLKPVYASTVYATETLATFIAESKETEPLATETSQWFDWQLKQNSNFERQNLINIDYMLMSGIGVMKVYAKKDGKVCFDTIDPIYVVVPVHTDELQEADRITHVMHFSKEQYKRDGRFDKKDQKTIDRICGKGQDQTDGGSSEKESERERREGLTFGHEDQVVVWEVWEHKEDGWTVHTFSPLAPDISLRKSFKNPYKHGKAPFVRFDAELKAKGHYDARGIPERLGSFEASLSKTWNEKLDRMTFASRPLFYTEREIPNASNLRFQPGQILPFALQAVSIPAHTEEFAEEMVHTRMVAEYNIGMPDFGLGQKSMSNTPRTAKEIGEITNISTQGTDLRSRIHRKSLGELYVLAWKTLLQYNKDTQFFFENKARQLPPEAIQDAYSIVPNGSADDWNKQARLQRAMARFSMFNGNPVVDQFELAKSVLELDDPKIVRPLLPDPAKKQQDQIARQATEVPTLLTGFPLVPGQDDDDALHFQGCVQFLQKQQAMGVQMGPDAVGAIQAHMQMHMQRLEQSNPRLAQQLKEAVQVMAEQGDGGQRGMQGAQGPVEGVAA